MIGDPDGDGGGGPDFFVSYTRSDQRWAEWIGWVLEDAGFRVLVQAWDFGPGGHFVAEMHEAARRSSRTVAVLSAAYLTSVFAAAEWQAAWAADPEGQNRRLLAFRVEDCAREGLLRQLVTVDLFGVDRETARDRLLSAVRGQRLKPEAEPLFPPGQGEVPGAGGEPVFPRPPVVWGTVWPRNPNFTGRAGELEALRGRFAGGSATAAVLPQALHGLGGVGKTQLAVEYAYRHSTDYDLVWWVPAEQPAQVVAALAALAAEVGVAVPGQAQDSAEAVAQVLRRRDRFPRWLVIADNAGAPSDLAGLLTAAGGGGHVLITSRDPAWTQVARTVEVDVLPRAEAAALLHARAPRLSDREAEQIAELLGDLPLALEQAGAWLARSGMGAGEYADAVKHRTRDILAEATPVGYPVPVAATWTVAIEELDDPVAVLLLRLWAFLGPEPIPTDLIGPGAAPLVPSGLTALAADPLARGRVIERITRLGLVRLVDQGVVMHRLVQAVLRDHTPPTQRDEIRRTVHAALVSAAPADPDDPTSWARYAQLYPHALATNLVDSDDGHTRRAVTQLAQYLHSAGDNRNSVALAQHAHRRWRHTLGEDHPHTIDAANNLALALRELGDYSGARTIHEDVLCRRRRVLGEDHPHTIDAADNLALALWVLGDYSGARTVQEDVLTHRLQDLGEDHPSTLRAADHLALTLRSLEDYSGARTIQEDVLTRRRWVLGEDHPDSLTTTGRLAHTLWALGDYSGART
ncbi:MAG: FxSxx-COOH system tetratricopeptide repeat protein, partial [Actinomycetota bacterium]|nr:FxSxx-COOH system tetratricopeptide repeat protein [Actinomycetota bacterium]